MDIWAGMAAADRPWSEDTLAPVFSVTKGAAALAAQMLADRGRLDVDAPVAAYWPEFAARGKERVLVREVLNHTAGTTDVPRIPGPGHFRRCGRVARDGPHSGPACRGAARVGTRDPGGLPRHFLRVAGGRAGASCGRAHVGNLLPGGSGAAAGPQLLDRFAEPVSREGGGAVPRPFARLRHARGVRGRRQPGGRRPVPRAGVHLPGGSIATIPPSGSAEAPAVNGVADARSVARMYAMLAGGGELDGVRIVSPASIAAHSAEQVRGTDAIFGGESRVALGYGRSTPEGDEPRTQ